MPHPHDYVDDCDCMACQQRRMYDKKCQDYDTLQVLVTDLQGKLTEAKAHILELELAINHPEQFA